MMSSAANIVKAYLEKYVVVNLLKTRKNKHEDLIFARTALSIAYHIIHDMENLIRTNNADDLGAIKECLTARIAEMHQAVKMRQPILLSWFKKNPLPPDFNRCVSDAWAKLQYYEKGESSLEHH